MPIARPLDSRTWLGLGVGLGVGVGLDSRTWSGQRRLGGPCGAAKTPRVVSAVRGACAPRLCPGLLVSLSVCLSVCLSVTSAALEAASSRTRDSGWAPGGGQQPSILEVCTHPYTLRVARCASPDWGEPRQVFNCIPIRLRVKKKQPPLQTLSATYQTIYACGMKKNLSSCSTQVWLWPARMRKRTKHFLRWRCKVRRPFFKAFAAKPAYNTHSKTWFSVE